ncbi:MAG: TolB protein [Actinomycetota bacterium]|nr:TolB protein [Actinomycetota bacterium]
MRAETRRATRAVVCAAVVVVAGGCQRAATPPAAMPVTTMPSPSPAERGFLASVPPLRRLPGRVAWGDFKGRIWVLRDGRRRLVAEKRRAIYLDPSWSPDGTEIVFRISSGQDSFSDPQGVGLDGIAVVDTRSLLVRHIEPSTGGLFPDWSPVDDRILYSGVDDLSQRLDTVQIMTSRGEQMPIPGHPGECGEWSPDATRILYCSHDGDGDFEVWVMDANGTHARQLTRAEGVSDGAIWSHDGTMIAFSSTRDVDGELYVMSADGSHERRVMRVTHTYEAPSAWIPGLGIVFASSDDAHPVPDWYSIHPDGSHLRSLPTLRGASSPLDWCCVKGDRG